MATKSFNVKQIQRKDTSANWTSANPTLSSGEIGYETDTGKTKIGDGTTAWVSLGYMAPVTSVNGQTGDVTVAAGGAVTSVNNKTGAVTLDAADVGALPSTTAIPEQRCYYGTCSTNRSKTSKVVSCDGFTLTTGSRIAVRFANENTATTMTLNVNSTGAETVRLKGSITLTGLTFPTDSVINFVYDGSYWEVENNYAVEAYNASNAVTLGGNLPSAFLSSAVTDISNQITNNQGTKNIIAKKMGNLVFIGGYFAGINVSANAETLIGSVAAGYRTLVGCSGSAYFLKNNATAYPGTVYFSAGGDILIMAPSALTSVDAYIGIMYMTS